MASHPPPFHRNRQSNKALDPNGPTAKFLYTILKQLDLKNIDWNEVASGLDITNGHAARMRWSRFRAQIEGLDNSYSRPGGKKRDGDKKRKREKAADSATTREVVNHKRVKAELAQGMATDTALRLDVYNDLEMPVAVKSERPEKAGTVDGITVHHPKMTTIEVLQPAQNGLIVKQDPLVANSTLAPIGRKVSKSVAPALPATHPYYSHSHEPDLRWPQHGSNPSYLYQYSATASPWGYQPFSSNYTSCYQYPGVYVGQNGQQQFVYDQNQPRIPAQQTTPYRYNGNSTSIPTTTSNLHNATMPQRALTLPAIEPSVISNFPPSTNSSPPRADNQTQTAAQICELASDASYPWPYSEALLANFAQESCEIPGDGGEGGNLIDLSDTDAEHVIDPDVGIHVQQSDPFVSDANCTIGTHNPMCDCDEAIITAGLVEQEQDSGVSSACAPASTACPSSMSSDMVKSEPEL